MGAHTSLEFATNAIGTVPAWTECNTASVQDKKHIILDYPSQDLTNLCTQFQHLFSSAPPSSATRHRDCMSQADTLGLAKSVCPYVRMPKML
eukprot:85945-Pelagomonas_calceolata.AAC.1